MQKKVKKAVSKGRGVGKRVVRIGLDNKWILFIIFLLALLLLINMPYIVKSFSYGLPQNLTAEKDAVSIPTQVVYTSSGVSGFVMSDQDVCLIDEKPAIMVFGKQDHSWTINAVNYVEKALVGVENSFVLEKWYSGNITENRQALFQVFNPTKSYPTLIVGCKYMKVGIMGSEDENVDNIKLILEKII